MSEEQRQAAIERLALAREKRLKENPPQYKNISPKVLAIPDDGFMSMKKVRPVSYTHLTLPTSR